MLRAIATMMFSKWYSDLIDSIVVRAAAPAIKGKIIGTTVALPDGLSLYLNISIPRIISSDMTKRIREPATANA